MPKVLHYARLLFRGAKSPIPKRKRQIIHGAAKEIERLEKQKTARTRMLEEATGMKSDIEKEKKKVAQKARRQLLGRR